MKRVFAALLAVGVFLSVSLWFMPQSFGNVLKKLPFGEVVIFCRSTSADATNIGNGFLVECDSSSFDKIVRSCQEVDGISLKFSGTKDDFLKTIEMFRLTSETFGEFSDVIVVCGYSRKLTGGVWSEGRKVNLQVAFDGNTITVGSPMILDSF